MPCIPATRQKTSKRLEEDVIQWTLIAPQRKKPKLTRESSNHSKNITTIDIANSFISLLRGNPNQVPHNEVMPLKQYSLEAILFIETRSNESNSHWRIDFVSKSIFLHSLI